MTSKYFSCGVQAVFFLALPLIGACSFAGQIAKDSVEGATSYYSQEHFTLVATIPAKFGFTSKAIYSPKSGEKCEAYSPGLGGNVTRQQQNSNTTDAKDIEQTASTDIPLEYHIADCSMELTRVSYEVSARYGTGSLDRDLELAGGLSVRKMAEADTKSRSPEVLEQRGLCAWYFQISTAKIKKGEVEKILSCEATGPEWKLTENNFKRRKPGGVLARNELAGKSVHVEFRLSPEEQPYYEGYWLKVPGGWKPCSGRQDSSREALCTTPPEFKTFKLNGRECSVYPRCNE
ncbi:MULTISPECIES: hypothetical protein [Pseudomonas]|uniref:hypothetical protein n=1 Tax=Pseudomonas TaxID=286 RepID=UPI00026FF439|nr:MULTISPECIES: hypothetical protein [Pseudomonas]EJM25430.1 hypothetical protein PMI24_04264 [Pseudomonas sp. GM25]MCU0092357.1 hypothetical protein [Pseudomonas koreensis]